MNALIVIGIIASCIVTQVVVMLCLMYLGFYTSAKSGKRWNDSVWVSIYDPRDADLSFAIVFTFFWPLTWTIAGLLYAFKFLFKSAGLAGGIHPVEAGIARGKAARK